MSRSKIVAMVLAVVVTTTAHLGSAGAVERTLIGYASPTTVRPGETVEFKVSTLKGPKSYKADLVKIIAGDSISRYGDMFEMRKVDAPFAGAYDSVRQDLNLGSYVEIEPSSSLNALESFTVGAWVFPTFDPTEYTPPDLSNIDPFSPPTLGIASSISTQTIVSRFDAASGTGWALQLDKDFHLALIVGSGGKSLETVRIDVPTKDWDWSYVAATYDATSGQARVYLFEMPYAPGDQFTARNLEASSTTAVPPQEGPLRIAALRDGAGAALSNRQKPSAVFNGRIQDVRLANRALGADELQRLLGETAPRDLIGSLVLDLDFSVDMKTDRIIDISGSANHGELVNVAERAVRGRYWKGGATNWTLDPASFDAIHFHADDLYDAEWKTNFSYVVPDDLASGAYAARLQHGDFIEYVTFFVTPPKGEARAKLALWLSTWNYLAYQNVSILATASGNYPGQNINPIDIDFMLDNLEFATSGVYNQHADGTYFIYGSPHRPDLQMKPDGIAIYNFPQDTYAIAFLEHEGIAYDVITDEMVDREGADLLNRYDAVLTSSHPEYVSGRIFDAVAAYTIQGGRLAYLGGNGWFWATAENPGFPGVVESRNFSVIGERTLTSGQPGGLMIETGRPSGPLVGLEIAAMIFNGSSAFERLEDAANPRAAWIFEGTTEGDAFGDYGIDKVHGGAVGFEIDRYNPANGTPRHALHLATSTALKPKIEDVVLSQLPLTIAYHPAEEGMWAQADIVFFETPNGGAVLSAGSINWMSSTPENDFRNDVAQITRNVLRRFLDPTPFDPVPADQVDDVDRAAPNPEYEYYDKK